MGSMQRKSLDLPEEKKRAYAGALEEKFAFLFEKLGMRDTKATVDTHVHPVLVHRPVPEALKAVLATGVA